MTSAPSKSICVGAFAGAHGIKGAALVKTFTDAPNNIDNYGKVTTEDGSRSFTLKYLRTVKSGFAIVTVPEISTREDAIALKGTRLYVDRDQLPPPDDGDFYHEDLIGLAAFDEIGGLLGRVNAVYNFGAGDLLELIHIPGINGVRVVPFTLALVPEVDIAAKRITVIRAAIDIDENAGPEPQPQSNSED